MPKVLNRYKDAIPREAVYIGRPSVWGNPFELHKGGGNRKEVIRQHYVYVMSNPGLVAQIKRELKGRDLVCFCSPKACHGDLLLAIANDLPLPNVDETEPDLLEPSNQLDLFGGWEK